MNKKWLIGTAAAVFLLGNATGAWAGSAWKEVKAYFNPAIKVEVNGQEAAGIKALKYDGSLYVPAKSIADYFGLTSKLVFDDKANKLTIGGPMYVSLYNGESKHDFQIVINGNWRPSILASDRKMYSNYYMGVDFRLESAEGVTLDDYVPIALKGPFASLPSKRQTKQTIAGADALVVDYESKDSVGKLVFLQKDSDFVTLNFFVEKNSYKPADLKEYDKIIASLTIA
ncbi:hypothetical protein [Paenibacillus sp. GCM10023250]|uniref:hypothetical protein n=1 Tax=Paenibacillus sp. GCM10023250 TaxID=3252648 RepID=UPI00361881DD